jgi:hypothetical protein
MNCFDGPNVVFVDVVAVWWHSVEDDAFWWLNSLQNKKNFPLFPPFFNKFFLIFIEFDLCPTKL